MTPERTEHFVLKEDGKLYWIEKMPEFPSGLNQFDPHDMAHYEKVILKDAITNAVEVSDQSIIKSEIEHKCNVIEIGQIYSLQCSVEIQELPLHPLEKAREQAIQNTYVPKSIRTSSPQELAKPKRKKVALVTFDQPEQKETQEEQILVRIKEEIEKVRRTAELAPDEDYRRGFLKAITNVNAIINEAIITRKNPWEQ